MSVLNIPAGRPFLKALARGIMKISEETEEPLSSFRILLPHRRACRSLRDTFLDLSDGKPLLLPQIRPLGDVDEEELSFAANPYLSDQILQIPPAISPFRRQFLLMQLVQKIEIRQGSGSMSSDQALRLAQALARLMDQVIIEDVPYQRLSDLVPEEFATHWQITIDFLKILSEAWPKVLEENGVIEGADRRNRILGLQAQYWQNHPPSYSVIAAGSTGTIPATAKLLSVIKDLPKGMIVLPGLDQDMDAESWDSLEDSHPQKTLKDLLQYLDVRREEIKAWSSYDREDYSDRSYISREMMRPAQTTDAWQFLEQTSSETYKDIERYDCGTQDEEALCVALKLRSALETPNKTAFFVTPDRGLARQVKEICERWNIQIDDTAGEKLIEKEIGQFILLSLNVFVQQFRPSVLLSLLKHPLCGFSRDMQDNITEMEKGALRGPTPKDVLETLSEFEPAKFFADLKKNNNPLTLTGEQDVKDLIEAHISVMEDLATISGKEGYERLWVGESGESAALLFSNLLQEVRALPKMSVADYLQVLQILMKDSVVRPKYGMHPRLMIMGQIEARLLQGDVMILGGLNEGSWPPDPGNDPWMSRPMRKEFGLPDSDRSIGQAAHDFVQAFQAKELVLTRSLRKDGSPTVPARWLERLDTVLIGLGQDPEDLKTGPLLKWAQALDKPLAEISPAPRPAPNPPVNVRPSKLPVTAIETWMRDPYSLYAKYVLGLRSLDPVEQKASAALKGNWLHDLLKWVVQTYPDHLPEDMLQIILERAAHHPETPASFNLWYPRFLRMMDWFLLQEKKWRELVRPLVQEQEGAVSILSLTLTAKADRIDIFSEGGAAIIDYKTGRIPTMKELSLGLSPQLPLEALILEKEGFGDVKERQVKTLAFWKLSGGNVAGEERIVKGRNIASLDDLIQQAQGGLEDLIQTFSNEKTPYISLPDPDSAPPEAWQDYAQLARVAEWIALDDTEAA